MNNKQFFDEIDITLKGKSKQEKLLITANNSENLNLLDTKLKEVIASKFGDKIKDKEIEKGSKLEADIRIAVIDYLNTANIDFEPKSLKAKAIDNFMLGLSGYGVLQPLMDDDTIEDIYIYAPDKIWYLKNGQKYFAKDIKFENKEKLKAFMDNILGRISRSINNKNPIEDGRLPDGSRIAVSAETLSPQGYTMSIRKFRKERIDLDKLVEYKEIDEYTKNLLIDIIKSRMNFLVSGGTSSGKTTILNAMSQYIDPMDNVCSIEDNIELQLNREFWLQLETRKANLEGNNEISMADLLKHLLRRSPDRIIVGEIRDPAVADTFLNAIQTGHDGCCATIHANDANRCKARVSKLSSVGSKQPFSAAIDDFNHSINIIIQLKKDEKLKRRVLYSIDWIAPVSDPNKNDNLVNIVKFDTETKTWIHNPIPEEMQKRIDEYK